MNSSKKNTSRGIATALLIALPVFAAGLATGWTLGSKANTPPSTPAEGWLSGSTDEKFGDVERHLRGLDLTMAEVGYRFTELYWAGNDQNWEYTKYQLDKIELTIRLGIERRPKRAASASPFLSDEIPAMRAAIEKENESDFRDGAERMRTRA